MTDVPAAKPKAYRPWPEIAAELAGVKDDLAKALELADELNSALIEQSPGHSQEEQEENSPEAT